MVERQPPIESLFCNNNKTIIIHQVDIEVVPVFDLFLSSYCNVNTHLLKFLVLERSSWSAPYEYREEYMHTCTHIGLRSHINTNIHRTLHAKIHYNLCVRRYMRACTLSVTHMHRNNYKHKLCLKNCRQLSFERIINAANSVEYQLITALTKQCSEKIIHTDISFT